ncbi:GTP cyclohydrolase I FolE [Clostridium sp. HCP1S3_B4]|uniref:GTP cyclohydrolase I FolE n=1 Tax=unclassified Clostridium TaxID=2614128 RepID=UPI0016918364|nr:GTP cyclohydrolase I FolE [Clostridiales bacterium]MDY2730490.1 GTP cyclohydrolase I FolE [Clostridium sp.]NLK24491.1 GTP cyclohydrolase I FolE [Clostridiales bacterium]
MVNKEKVREGVKLILEAIGEDVNREGLVETPDRIARMYEEIFSGINKEAKEHLQKTFKVDSDDLVLEKDITFYSMCEHHLVPFYGKVHIAYIPNGRVAGLSKLARTVEVYAKKPQLQERLTKEIADAIMKYLDAKGVMVVIEAEHMCMTMRGVKKPGTKTMTTTYRGQFKEDYNLRKEVLSLIKDR